jgi:hypothetical protein
MSRHDGVSCDSCMKGNFRGRRFKCLVCYDYDLCSNCFENGVSTTRHSATHPMQCILTRTDSDLYFGGDSSLSTEHQNSFTCPFCAKMGYTESTLQEHVSSQHSDVSQEVVCPICASFPGGDPNHLTDDFQNHLNVEHRSGARDLVSFLDEPGGLQRQNAVRRIANPRGALSTHRTRRHNNPPTSSILGGPSSLSSLSPSTREAVDPIAELLNQLSGVRRATGSSSSQLQQLQMELQLQRQQAQAHMQTLDRLARRGTQGNHGSSAGSASAASLRQSSSSSGNTGSAGGVMSQAAAAAAAGTLASVSAAASSSQIGSGVSAGTGIGEGGHHQLLPGGRNSKSGEAGYKLYDLESEESGEESDTARESAKQNLFIQELFLSALNLEDSDTDENNS